MVCMHEYIKIFNNTINPLNFTEKKQIFSGFLQKSMTPTFKLIGFSFLFYKF